MFDSNPNQKKIIIKKEKCNADNTYTTLSIAAIQNAMNTLTNAEFKVWMYLAKNKDNYKLDLSPAEAMRWGIKRSTMQETIRKFVDIGYLDQIDDAKNQYFFYEMPKVKKL